MKKVWIIILIITLTGLMLSIIGIATGANRTLYLDKTGVHISGSTVSIVEESNLEAFREIYVDVSFSDIEILRSDTFGIELYGENVEWDWTLEEDHDNYRILKITDTGELRVPILHFDFDQKQQNFVKIYLPENLTNDNKPYVVDLKTGSGNIRLGGFNLTGVKISNSFGNVDIETMVVGGMFIDLKSGNFNGSNLLVSNFKYSNQFGDGHFESVRVMHFTAESNSGDLHFTQCEFGIDYGDWEREADAPVMKITSGFGNINARDLISWEANIEAGSGNINIAGEFFYKTVIESRFGDVKLTTSRGKDEYSLDVSVKFGNITINGERLRDQTSIVSGSVLENHIEITSSSGDVEVTFGN